MVIVLLQVTESVERSPCGNHDSGSSTQYILNTESSLHCSKYLYIFLIPPIMLLAPPLLPALTIDGIVTSGKRNVINPTVSNSNKYHRNQALGHVAC